MNDAINVLTGRRRLSSISSQSDLSSAHTVSEREPSEREVTSRAAQRKASDQKDKDPTLRHKKSRLSRIRSQLFSASRKDDEAQKTPILFDQSRNSSTDTVIHHGSLALSTSSTDERFSPQTSRDDTEQPRPLTPLLPEIPKLPRTLPGRPVNSPSSSGTCLPIPTSINRPRHEGRINERTKETLQSVLKKPLMIRFATPAHSRPIKGADTSYRAPQVKTKPSYRRPPPPDSPHHKLGHMKSFDSALHQEKRSPFLSHKYSNDQMTHRQFQGKLKHMRSLGTIPGRETRSRIPIINTLASKRSETSLGKSTPTSNTIPKFSSKSLSRTGSRQQHLASPSPPSLIPVRVRNERTQASGRRHGLQTQISFEQYDKVFASTSSTTASSLSLTPKTPTPATSALLLRRQKSAFALDQRAHAGPNAIHKPYPKIITGKDAAQSSPEAQPSQPKLLRSSRLPNTVKMMKSMEVIAPVGKQQQPRSLLPKRSLNLDLLKKKGSRVNFSVKQPPPPPPPLPSLINFHNQSSPANSSLDAPRLQYKPSLPTIAGSDRFLAQEPATPSTESPSTTTKVSRNISFADNTKGDKRKTIYQLGGVLPASSEVSSILQGGSLLNTGSRQVRKAASFWSVLNHSKASPTNPSDTSTPNEETSNRQKLSTKPSLSLLKDYKLRRGQLAKASLPDLPKLPKEVVKKKSFFQGIQKSTPEEKVSPQTPIKPDSSTPKSARLLKKASLWTPLTAEFRKDEATVAAEKRAKELKRREGKPAPAMVLPNGLTIAQFVNLIVEGGIRLPPEGYDDVPASDADPLHHDYVSPEHPLTLRELERRPNYPKHRWGPDATFPLMSLVKVPNGISILRRIISSGLIVGWATPYNYRKDFIVAASNRQPRARPHMALLLVSKFFYAHGTEVLYQNNEFQFNDPSMLIRFLATLDPSVLRGMSLSRNFGIVEPLNIVLRGWEAKWLATFVPVAAAMINCETADLSLRLSNQWSCARILATDTSSLTVLEGREQVLPLSFFFGAMGWLSSRDSDIVRTRRVVPPLILMAEGSRDLDFLSVVREWKDFEPSWASTALTRQTMLTLYSAGFPPLLDAEVMSKVWEWRYKLFGDIQGAENFYRGDSDEERSDTDSELESRSQSSEEALVGKEAQWDREARDHEVSALAAALRRKRLAKRS